MISKREEIEASNYKEKGNIRIASISGEIEW